MDAQQEAAVATASLTVDQPLDLIRLSLDEVIEIRCKFGRQLRGRLQAYDGHLNLILSDVKETISFVEVDTETLEEHKTSQVRNFDLLFVRGDTLLLIIPPVRA